MKRIIVIMFFFALCGALLAAADGQEFNTSTQVLLSASVGPMGLVGGLGVDASFISHVVGSFAVGMPFPDYGSSPVALLGIWLKFFFLRNNTGFYALTGPVFIIAPEYYFDSYYYEGPSSVLFFMAGLGIKAKFLGFFVFFINLSAPATAIFVYSEDLLYSGVLMVSLGVEL